MTCRLLPTLHDGDPHRVFLDVSKTGQGMCPYCGTVYVLKAGEIAKGH